MYKRVSIALLAVIFLVALLPTTLTTGPTQPPVDTTTLYVGRGGWGPKYADPVRAYDSSSCELIFNIYDRLIDFGADVTNQWLTWDVEEQYWEFSPNLATNVPTSREVIMDFTNTSFTWTTVIRNETAVAFNLRGLLNPTCTWWQDDLPEPFNSYYVSEWIDTNGDGIVDFSDYIFVNDYWWAPTVPQETALKGCRWWHVIDVTVEINAGMIWRLTLEYVAKTFFDPFNPECTWFEAVLSDGRLYHISGYVDNDPTIRSPLIYDVIYLEEFYNVTTFQGWTLLPATTRTWHVMNFTLGPQSMLRLHRFYYDFQIRTLDPSGNPIRFVDAGGTVVDVFDIYDAEYSLERGLVQDQYGSPMWMFYKPFFDQMNSDYWDTGNVTDAIALSYLIQDAVEVVSVDPPILRVNVGIPFPNGRINKAFLQIMCGPWASIVSKEYSIGIGCWNGDLFLDANQNCYPDWFETGSLFVTWWRHIHRSPYDNPSTYVGTGPYYNLMVPVPNLVVLQRNQLYWKGWSAPQKKAYLEFIDIEYVPDWVERREAFKACQLDMCDVPRVYMSQLLDPSGNPASPEIKTIKNLSPSLMLDAVFFTFTTDPTAPGIFTGSLPDGIPYNFFNNSYVRKAFSYAFNRSSYLSTVYLGEAICRETPDIYCLTPDYYTYGPDPPWTYDINATKVIEMLQQAMFTQDDVTRSVWDWGGFHLIMYYNAGNDDRRMACERMKTTFDEINAANDKAFIIDVVGVDWPSFLNSMEEFMLPAFITGWQADFADADNLKRSFMHSSGYFARIQNYTVENGWTTLGSNTTLNKDVLIDLALKTSDNSSKRTIYYSDLDGIYIADDPSLPVAQPIGRKWVKYWVKGWYYNALYGASVSPFLGTCDYFYKLYKENTCWADVMGAALPPQYIPYPDGVCSMRDIGYIAGHFGAKAPDPYRDPPYDSKWAPGTYGCYGCDVYGDRKIDMRDIGFACAHFGHTTQP